MVEGKGRAILSCSLRCDKLDLRGSWPLIQPYTRLPEAKKEKLQDDPKPFPFYFRRIFGQKKVLSELE